VFINPAAVPNYPPLPQPGQPNPYGQPQGPQFSTDPPLRDRARHEPDWTKRGTYCVVRASSIDLARWDRESLGIQEHVIGRLKVSGASLDLTDDPSQLDQLPAFATNPTDDRVPINAHVRKANPAARTICNAASSAAAIRSSAPPATTCAAA
jgi:deferrochelatase/peroxidase EfeB